VANEDVKRGFILIDITGAGEVLETVQILRAMQRGGSFPILGYIRMDTGRTLAVAAWR
jgi:hypothetical protein